MFANIPPITNLAGPEQLSWDIAKQIIQSKSNLAIYGITVLVGVAAVLVAASWIWNVFLGRHELERTIKSLKSEITTKVEGDFIKLTERFNDQAVKMREGIEKRTAERMTLFDAEMARLFALANIQMQAWENVVDWRSRAIEGYAKAGKKMH